MKGFLLSILVYASLSCTKSSTASSGISHIVRRVNLVEQFDCRRKNILFLIFWSFEQKDVKRSLIHNHWK